LTAACSGVLPLSAAAFTSDLQPGWSQRNTRW